jgi:NADH-quinone oxidoreductase subunit L
VVGWVAGIVRWFQSGYLYHYALAMILGILVLMSYFVTWPSLRAALGL